MKRLLVVAAIAILAVAVGAGIGASSAAAGEVTGNCNHAKSEKAADNCKGTEEAGGQVSNGNSWCRYSGQNDKPDSTDPADPGGNTQNWGHTAQANTTGSPDPSVLKGGSPSPGTECSPNKDHNAVPDGSPPRK